MQRPSDEDSRSPRPPRLLGSSLVAVLVLAVLSLSAAASESASASSAGCASASYGSPGYGYAGFQSQRRGHGVRASLTALAGNGVSAGHVAAWVGVGGPNQGPNGVDEWLQVGLASFPGQPRNVYYELMRPGGQPDFTLVEANVPRGAQRRVAVLEMSRRPQWWRVWVDGRPASKPIHLPGSSGAWQPIATAEAWDGGARVCNRFAFRFERVEVAGGRGGSWTRFLGGYRFQDSGYRLSPLGGAPAGAKRAQSSRGATSFVAASV
jgi:hypothetical protein